MRAFSTSITRLDILNGVHETAEVAKFAANFGYRIVMQPSEENGFREAVMTRTAETELRDDLAHLTYLVAMTDNKSVDDVLTTVRDRLEQFHHVDVTMSPADQPGVGDRHPGGH